MQKYKPLCIGFVIMVLVSTLTSSRLFATTIDFNDNEITFFGPTVIGSGGIGGEGAEVIVSTAPTKIKLADGEQIQGLAYTVKATSTEFEIGTAWFANRSFTLSDKSDLTIHISGSTDVTINAGTATFFFQAQIDNDSDQRVAFLQQNIGAGTTAVSWDKSGVVKGVAAGMHTLVMGSGISQWNPTAIGDTIQITSEYESKVAAVPELSAISLLMVGAITLPGIAFIARRKCQRS